MAKLSSTLICEWKMYFNINNIKWVIRIIMYLNFELHKSCYRPPGEKIHRILIVDYSVLQSNIPVSEVCWLQFSKSSFQTSRNRESRHTWGVIQNNGHPPSSLTEFGANTTTPQPAWKSSDQESDRMKVKPNSSITCLKEQTPSAPCLAYNPSSPGWSQPLSSDTRRQMVWFVWCVCVYTHTYMSFLHEIILMEKKKKKHTFPVTKSLFLFPL